MGLCGFEWVVTVVCNANFQGEDFIMERELLGQLVSASYFQLRYQFTLPQAATVEVLPFLFSISKIEQYYLEKKKILVNLDHIYLFLSAFI